MKNFTLFFCTVVLASVVSFTGFQNKAFAQQQGQPICSDAESCVELREWLKFQLADIPFLIHGYQINGPSSENRTYNLDETSGYAPLCVSIKKCEALYQSVKAQENQATALINGFIRNGAPNFTAANWNNAVLFDGVYWSNVFPGKFPQAAGMDACAAIGGTLPSQKNFEALARNPHAVPNHDVLALWSSTIVPNRPAAYLYLPPSREGQFGGPAFDAPIRCVAKP